MIFWSSFCSSIFILVFIFCFQSFNGSEKTKLINTKGGGGEFSFTKVGQQMNVAGRPPPRSDIAKTPLVGNFQVLNREKNSIFPAAKDGSSVPSAAVPPPKSQAAVKLRVDEKNCALTRVSIGERKLLSRAQNRNDFFNLLRKKSLTTSSSIPESGSIETMENLRCSSLVNIQKNGHQGLDCSAENGSFTNEGCLSTDETDRLYADNEKTKSFLDGGIDPEEEAFLRSLGWDKNAGEEALTQEEIDSFLKKVCLTSPSFFFVSSYPCLYCFLISSPFAVPVARTAEDFHQLDFHLDFGQLVSSEYQTQVVD